MEVSLSSVEALRVSGRTQVKVYNSGLYNFCLFFFNHFPGTLYKNAKSALVEFVYGSFTPSTTSFFNIK